MIALKVNDKSFDLNVEPETPLLWVLRDTIGLTGSKFMAASALLARQPQPTDADIDREMTNICRCGTYAEIRSAIRKASALMSRG